MAAGSHAFVLYLNGIWPGLLAWPTILGFLLLLGLVNFIGMRLSSAANVICTSIEVTGLLIVLIAGVAFLTRGGNPPVAGPPVEPATWLAILQGGALAFYAFVGFEDVVNVSEEVKNPQRTVPLAIVTALAIAGLVYMCVVIVAVMIVPPDELAAADGPLLEVVKRAAPAVPVSLFTFIALFAITNTALLNYVMGSRLLYGMSQQRLLPGLLSRVHPTRGTPYVAIAAVFLIAIALALSNAFQTLAGTTSVLLLTVFFSVHVSLVVIKLREPGSAQGFRVPLAAPALGAVTCLGLLTFVPRSSFIPAAVILAVGIAILLVHWIARRSSGGSAGGSITAAFAD